MKSIPTVLIHFSDYPLLIKRPFVNFSLKKNMAFMSSSKWLTLEHEREAFKVPTAILMLIPQSRCVLRVRTYREGMRTRLDLINGVKAIAWWSESPNRMGNEAGPATGSCFQNAILLLHCQNTKVLWKLSVL